MLLPLLSGAETVYAYRKYCIEEADELPFWEATCQPATAC